MDGVTFEMGGDNRLVMVVRQPGAAAPQKLAVTGVRLRQLQQQHSQGGAQQGLLSSNRATAGGEGSNGGSASMASSEGGVTGHHTPALDLLTTGGAHTIELATESDWAGLVVGLNAMLLLLEQEGPEAVQRVGAMPMSQAAWSKAVSGVDC